MLRPSALALIPTLLLLLLGGVAAAADPAAAGFLGSISPSCELEALLVQDLAELAEPELAGARVRIALLDLSDPAAPRYAGIDAESAVYPASVVKFVYLMAAYRWQEEGRLRIDEGLAMDLEQMIHVSSNFATQNVFRRLTATEVGPALSGAEYAEFRQRRMCVKDWLVELGIRDLHCVHPTYNSMLEIGGRDEQFLRDRSVSGGLPSDDGEFSNRQAMTAGGTARLLGLLALDLALTPESSAAAREYMRRDPLKEPPQRKRISGGAMRHDGIEVFSKTGTWGPIWADAGIVRHVSGRQLVLAVYVERSPIYTGELIANLADRLAGRLQRGALTPPPLDTLEVAALPPAPAAVEPAIAEAANGR